MRRALLVLTILTLPIYLFASEVTSKTIKLPAFNRIAIVGSYKIRMVQTSNPALTISGQASIVERINVSVRDGLLMVEMPKQRDRRMRLKSAEIPTLHLSFRSINNLFIDGSANITSPRPLKFENLELMLKGASKLGVALVCSNLTIETSGAAYLKIKGTSRTFVLRMKGSGMFDGYNLVTEKAKVIIEGTGKARINAQERLSGSISVFGTLFYKGNPIVDVSKNFGIVKQIP
ncbi:head GIN domain-containing protein [uncultured Acetobacteroides sp.]|uniref:head GIN domain-containing protein n=1 Tax=uncultured Acetobacteroides sp. TaxID=1760811 RepID=UPI0029F55E7C|nr:head GIN domain-containing protein [uncultured Acetobacteroides sp.]